MKKRYVILILFLFLIAISVYTNPNEQKHKDAVKHELKSLINQKSNSDNMFAALGNYLFKQIGENYIDENVRSKNYLVFSITKIMINNAEHDIGFGAWGNVYISDEIKNEIQKKLESKNEPSQKISVDPYYPNNENTITENNTTTIPQANYEEPVETNQNIHIETDTTVGNVEVAGYYISKEKAYFHNDANIYTKRNAYLVENDIVYTETFHNGFCYVEFGPENKKTKGWISLSSLQYCDDCGE